MVDSTDGVFANGNDSATTGNNVTLTVKNTLAITNAKTFDSNANGYINGYTVTFNNPLPANLLASSQIAVSTNTKNATGINFSGIVGSYSGTITFDDNLFTSSETPKIDITGDATYDTGTYFVGVVEDKAPPYVTVSPVTGTYTGSKTVTMSLSEAGTIRYSLVGTATAASPIYTTGIVINSPTTISTYSTDLIGNSSTANHVYSFGCSATAPVHGSISAYPACVVSCNANYVMGPGNICYDTIPPVITVTPPGGAYTGSKTVTIGLSETGTIRYSFTGPANIFSPLYTGPLTINSNKSLHVYAVDLGGNISFANHAYSFSCAQTVLANGNVSAYPNCTKTCYSGYILSG